MTTAIERAYALAASGRVKTIKDIRHVLRSEGYVEEGQLFGGDIRRQLLKLIGEAAPKKAKMAPQPSASPGLEQDSQGNAIPFEYRTAEDQEMARRGK